MKPAHPPTRFPSEGSTLAEGSIGAPLRVPFWDEWSPRRFRTHGFPDDILRFGAPWVEDPGSVVQEFGSRVFE